MSLNASEHVLAYWQWFNSLEQLNTFEDKFQAVETDLKVAEPKIEIEGVSGDAWLCPFVLEHHEGHFPLIWLAVSISEEGQIKPHPKLTMPYAPEQWFNPLGKVGALLGKQEIFDGLLQREFAPIDELEPIACWSDYYQKACDVFKASQPELYEQWHNQKNQKGRIFSVSSLSADGPLSQLLFDDEQNQSVPPLEEAQALKLLPNLCQPSDKPAPGEIYPIVLQLLSLPEYTMQAVKTCAKSAHQALSTTLIASLQLTAVLEQKKTRVLWVTHEPNHCFQGKSAETALEEAKTWVEGGSRQELTGALIELFEKEVREGQKALECLTTVFGESKQALKQQKTQRATLQKRDELLEKEVVSLNKTLKQWRHALKRTWVKKVVDYVMGNNESVRTSEFIAEHAQGMNLKSDLTLEENITQVLRAKKVERTKIHRQLMHLSESIAAQEGGLQTWKKLKAEHPELSTDLTLYEAMTVVASKFSKLASLLPLRDPLHEEPFFECQYSSPNSLMSEVQGPFEWVIVQEGHEHYAHHLLPILNQAKRAVILGDFHLIQRSAVPHAMDYWLIQASLGKTSEEVFEDMQFSSKVLSQSSLLTQAQASSYYLETDPSGLVPVLPFELRHVDAHPDLMDYNLRHIHPTIKMHPIEGPGVQTLHVEGTMDSWCNKLEAQALVDYIEAHPHPDCCVVTLAFPQKQWLQQALGAKVPVYTLEECPLNCTQVLFSPVYTSSTPRPHPLDYGEHLIYRLMSTAVESLIFIGDLRIFDPITHSPTGHLARFLFSKDRQIKDVQVSYGQDTQAVEHEIASVLVRFEKSSSPLHLTSKTMSEQGLTSWLEFLQQNPVAQSMNVYLSSLTFGEQDYKNPQLQGLMQEIAKLGVSWFRVKNLHRNVIMNEQQMVESTHPWLTQRQATQRAWEYTNNISMMIETMKEVLEQARPIVFEEVVPSF